MRRGDGGHVTELLPRRTRAGLYGVTWDQCPVIAYDTVAGRCARCGAVLTGRRTRWCSRACELVYEENHYWNAARAACLRRDLNRCVRCGWKDVPGQLALPMGIPGYFKTHARSLEVNHIVPRNGAGYDKGCHHHLTNLETLCHEHHVRVTKRQRIARSRFKARRGDKAQEALHA